jgi:predicted transcriptional regulator
MANVANVRHEVKTASYEERTNRAELRQAAMGKIQTGGLMTIEEVAALIDVTPATVHRLPLPSIRVGRSLRFDAHDVCQMILFYKEPVVA